MIDDRALDEAIDRVVAGPQKRTRIMNDKEKKITAYHEGGHALVAAALRHTDPVTKVTILPRGRALGYTMVLPIDDKYSTTRNEMLDQLAYALGGRVAEELVFHDPTTGAGERHREGHRRWPARWSPSTACPSGSARSSSARARARSSSAATWATSVTTPRRSPSVVDEEVRRLIETAHDEAWEVLVENRGVLDDLVLQLLEQETLNKDELAEVFAPRRASGPSGRCGCPATGARSPTSRRC